ncbi:hypothetical protein CLV42_1364 [Chitinophaga ginsengisoli]|uniref:Uncharacterized protein n=1 Tax=Chitinophaga ginsengisoli TaxID=363837 RepID=A0A2P8F959_9BACT|nr:hypothetical protein CLV42_1364 [Chitinophaga ginsengisoli]
MNEAPVIDRGFLLNSSKFNIIEQGVENAFLCC